MMMEKVEIPTIYFTSPKREIKGGVSTSSSSEFWNSLSQSQIAVKASSRDVCSRKVVWDCEHCDITVDIADKGGENETQSDQNHKNSSLIITPRRKQRSNAKLKLQFKCLHEVFFLISLLTLSLFCQVSEECPMACECKWKSGKESVICANAKTKLTGIPNDLDPGTQLLDLSKNNIQHLQAKVFHALNLLNLQKIFLSECNLMTLETNVFYKLNNLVELDISSNKIDSVPTSTFDQIPELRELKLNSNPISRISNNAFPLTRLVRLELSRCRIRFVDSAAFRSLVSLEWLKLDNNRLLTIQVVSFYPLRNLHGLEIHENPWNCSCTLQPFRDWMSKNNVPYGVPPVCSDPPRLAGKSWDQLQPEDFACLPKVQSSVQSAETGELTKAIEGENATLVCRLQATADTQVRWMNGNKQVAISSSSSSRYSLSESFVQGSGEGEKATPLPTSNAFSGAKLALGTKTSRLTVIRTKLRDSGTYSCRAETRAGSVSANFTLHVLQLSAEHISGRFLLYGATVAALLTLSICLLLLCIVFFCGKSKTNVLTEDKIELNHVNQNGRLPQNGHSPHNRNGGTSIPLLQNHSHANKVNGTPNHAPKNITSGLLSNFSITSKRINQDTGSSTTNNCNPPTRGLRNPQYKALPTNDPLCTNSFEPDSSSDLEDNVKLQPNFSTCANKNSKVLIVNVPEHPNPSAVKHAIPEQKFPDLINEERSPSQRNVDNCGTHNNMQLSVRPKALLSPKMATTANSTHPTESMPSNSPTVKPHRNSESEPLKPSLLLSSTPKAIPSGTSQPPLGKSGGGYSSPATSMQSVASNSSNSNISKNDSPYGSTSTYQTVLSTSTPPTFTKFTFTQRPAPPVPARHLRTSSFSSSEAPNSRPTTTNPNHISYYKQPAGQQYSGRGGGHSFQRRSMPTSPIHLPSSIHPPYDHYTYTSQLNNPHKFHPQGSDPGLTILGQSAEYDYHAAQLAAFLEEYRQLQMELYRMSASLTEMDPTPQQPPSNTGTNTNINLNTSLDPLTGQRVPTNANVDFHQQQYNNSIHKSGSNNNYLV